MLAMLLDHPDFSPADLGTVRTIGYGASAMPESLLRRLLTRTDVGLCQSYGMTELSGSIAFLTVADHRLAADSRPELLQSVGKPLPSVEVRLVHEDGRFDAEGYLYIVDRKKDMIISGGENVASKEVEEVMRRHPVVKDCAVIGLPDPKWGELICAVVQLAGEASDQALSDHCRQLLAPYKTPKRWVRVESLPVNAAGKIDKPALRLAQASSGDTTRLAKNP